MRPLHNCDRKQYSAPRRCGKIRLEVRIPTRMALPPDVRWWLRPADKAPAFPIGLRPSKLSEGEAPNLLSDVRKVGDLPHIGRHSRNDDSQTNSRLGGKLTDYCQPGTSCFNPRFNLCLVLVVSCDFSFTPRLQPGLNGGSGMTNRFNGFHGAALGLHKTV